MKAKLFDKVLLKDGTIGHVVEVYERDGQLSGDYEVEPHPYDPRVGLTITVNESAIKKIISD